MVDVQTNLLKNRQTLSEKDYQRERSYLRISVIGLVLVVVLVVAISIWNFVLSRKLAGIEGAMTKSSKEMQSLAQASAQQVYLKSRLNLITEFLSGRVVTRESLQKVFTVTIPGTHVVGVSFLDDSTLSVQYEASYSKPLSELLSYYQADTGYFTQVVSTGLTRSVEGSYQLSLVLGIPKETK